MKIVYNTKVNENLSPAELIEKSLLQTSSLLRRQKDAILEPHGINVSKLNILQLLNSVSPEGLSQNDIRERITDKTLDLPRIVKQLAQRRYVKSVRLKNNRRISEVTITPHGVEILKDVEKNLATVKSALSDISTEDTRLVTGILHQIYDKLIQNPVIVQSTVYSEGEPLQAHAEVTSA